jgi:hypothetical protein
MTGYLDRRYAEAVAEGASAFELPRSGGWLLRRAILGAAADDAAGPYPLFACRDWQGLPADLAELGEDLVSVVAVADPLGAPRGVLERAFPYVRRFKEHFVVDLTVPHTPTSHHRRNVRRALRKVRVEPCDPPRRYLADWLELYGGLVRRHRIEGPAAFSEASFRLQFETPGLLALRAVEDDRTVAMTLWFRHGPAAYYHLAASTDAGYRSGATYPLVWEAISRLREDGVELIDLGGVPGVRDVADHGLRSFKAGWATETRWAHLCGRVVNEARYAALAGPLKLESEFFPAYRDPGLRGA